MTRAICGCGKSASSAPTSPTFEAKANKLIHQGKIKPVLDEVFEFEQTAEAHQAMAENRHRGKMAVRVQAPR